VRVYIPLTVAGLAALHSSGRIAPAPVNAHAVTPELRTALGDGSDDEELEYAALMAAAADSLRLIAASDAEPRRIVVAAEVDTAVEDAGVDTVGPAAASRVRLDVEIPLSRCRSVHVDDSDAEGEIAEALRRIAAADAEQSPLDDVELVEHELMWFATQEIPDLLR
jgi:hypothetical protein